MSNAVSFVAGLIFGLGLIVAGMANPAKVLNFLDLAGKWDPSLAFVMASAVAVAILPFTYAKRRSRSLLGLPMQLPARLPVDRRLIGGSLIFGIGWGLAGICPGPSIVLLGAGIPKGVAFFISMLAGMALFEFLGRHRAKGGHAAPLAHASSHSSYHFRQ